MKKIVLLICVLMLSGCFWNTKKEQPVVVDTKVQPIPVFHPPLPNSIGWQEVEWKVLTPAIMKEMLDQIEAGQQPTFVFYGLTPDGYRALSENVADIQRYIKQSNTLLMYYRKNLVEIVVEQKESITEEK